MLKKTTVPIYTARCSDGISLSDFKLQDHPASRATRLMGDTTRLLLVSIAKNVEDYTLRGTLSHWVREGLEVHDVCYRYLGFTESQVKVGKLMFFREDPDWTVERLLASFGDLRTVYLKSGYGTYVACLGLSFSCSIQSLEVPQGATLEIPDLRAPDGTLYTDGCGMIRDSFAKALCMRHDFPLDTSVFQVQHRGIQGLLVRYPDERFEQTCGNVFQAHFIAYRPSMCKYEGRPMTLEINNYSQPPACAHLNIQLTVLLLSLGVQPEVFLRLLQDQLDAIDAILSDRESALQYIKAELDAGVENDYSQGLYAMLLAQQNMSEPYVKQRLQHFQKTQHENLRHNMNLRVVDSCYLYGVVDEYGVLGANEVYINLPGRCGVLVRDLIVARNPSYHPGDIRKLRAVDHPLLRHLRNCIVFSRNAPRSIPDTMASGDLDGDMYMVIWEPTLLPSTDIAPLDRASLSSTAGKASCHNIRQLCDMPRAAVETFIQLKFSRLLGQMVNEWSKSVELTPDLANGEFPRQLVPLIESALDITKTGQDFGRVQSEYRRLRSRNALRRLDTSPLQVLRAMIPQVHEPLTASFVCDPALILERENPRRWQKSIAEAKRVMPRYIRELSRAIELDRESGDTEYVSRSRASPDERPPRQADAINRDYRSRYFGGGKRDEHNLQRIRASAWYYYGYSENKAAFAWLGERYLNEIRALWSNGNKPVLCIGVMNQWPPVSSPLSRADSQATLVEISSPLAQPATKSGHDDPDMDVDPIEDKSRHRRSPTTTACRAHLHFHPHVVDTADARIALLKECDIKTTSARVSTIDHPKPKAPVAGRYTDACSRSASGHMWNVLSSNGCSRRYMCLCGYEVHEKKENGFWTSVSAVFSARRSPRASNTTECSSTLGSQDPETPSHPALRTRSHTRGTKSSYRRSTNTSPLSMIHPPTWEEPSIDAGIEDENDQSISEYEDAVEDLSPLVKDSKADGGRRSSGGTTSSDTPSSLAGLPYLRRLPGRPIIDVSSPIGRLRQVSSCTAASDATSNVRTTRTSAQVFSQPSPVVSEVLPSHWPLVSEDPKPCRPVASAIPPCQGSPRHLWKLWGNAKSRHYTCKLCAFVAKERKSGSPEVWVPMH
ncbi:RNA dependent RNA polymerase-domain-containing protein [Trametes gibbosa]|nr:RNA dependent RNA polymerase-domain-containing protein [Trametes gibbosa]